MVRFKHISGISIFVCICIITLLNYPLSFAEETGKFIYNSQGKRDPFIPLVGASYGRGASSKEILGIDDVNFQGIARDAKGKRIIIVNGEVLREGDKLDALNVIRITEEEAIVKIRDKEYNLNLYEKEK